MSLESQLAELENEANALCSTFSVSSTSLKFYHKEATIAGRGDIKVTVKIGTVQNEITLAKKVKVVYKTKQNANTIASLQSGSTMVTSRIPHNEGAAWIVDARNNITIKVSSIFDGEIEVEDL